jgi:endonuclease YncB( thermonuclease family)
MRRVLSLGIICFLLALVVPGALTSAAQSALPAGVPDGAQRATVTTVIDGDTIKVSLNKKGTVIELAGIDAPEDGECFAADSHKRLQKLVPKPTTVYIEESGIPNDNGVTGFVWLPGKDGAKATLLNTKLVREGYAGYFADPQLAKYGERLAGYEGDAQAAGKGVWGACAALHEQLPPPPTPTPDIPPTPTPTSGFTPEEQAYADGVTDILDYLLPSFDKFSSLMADMSADPYLMLDGEWKFGVGLQLGIWKAAYEDALTLTPPDSMASVHALFLESLRLYSEAADNIAYGIDNLDLDSLEYGASLMSQANAQMNLASDELGAFLSSR